MADAEAWLAKYGRPPTDPLRVKLMSVQRHVADLAEQVREAAQDFAPYRPGVDPWIKQGLAAKLRPDFKARGVTDPDT